MVRIEDLISGEDAMLTTAQVARIFAVASKTVNRWVQEGQLRSITTIGGHRRFLKSDVEMVIRLASERSKRGF